MKIINRVAWVVASVLMVGCGDHAREGQSSSASTSNLAAGAVTEVAGGIEWFHGSVEAAFEQAKAQNKPVFLYWGAVWCPPCHELQASVFSRPDFVAQLKSFVAVHLDGDEPGAQKWGDVFGVTGYPTVVVMKADRTELARIAGGLDLSRYAEVLEQVLGDARPIRDVLLDASANEAKKAPETLSKEDCRRLAYYDWTSTDDIAIQAPTLVAALAGASTRCGATDDGARLSIIAAGLAAQLEVASLTAGSPPSSLLINLVGRMDVILQDATLSLKVADALRSLPAEFFDVVVRMQPSRVASWSSRYATAMEAAASDPRFSVADHIYSLYAKLEAEQRLDPRHQISPAVAADARVRIDKALAQRMDEHTRSSVVNAAFNIESELLQDDDRAYAMLMAQMARSSSAYYYMLDISAIDEKRGNTDTAVDWLTKAYEQSEGPATRFQWGVNYVLGLLRMKPADDARIREAALAVLGELDGPDRIHRRTRVRLGRLDQALSVWNQQGVHAATITTLRARMNDICRKLSLEDPARATCTGFLNRA
jgi:thiol-disulfide isomerase/thioredoxin